MKSKKDILKILEDELKTTLDKITFSHKAAIALLLMETLDTLWYYPKNINDVEAIVKYWRKHCKKYKELDNDQETLDNNSSAE